MMWSNKVIARTAGLLYLMVVISGIFSLLYVPSRLFVPGNAASTIQNIRNAETFFRLGIAAGFICYISFLLLPIALYHLLRPVHEIFARLMVVLAAVSVPVSIMNLQNKLAVLSLINDTADPGTFSAQQAVSLASHYLDQYDNGILTVSVFWGLWLLPFGYLVFKSGILPKLLGVLLMLGCFGYLINFFGHCLLPHYAKTGVAPWISLPASLGEIGTCLWLLIAGAKEYKTT
jgi:hypothetical protein